MRGIKTRSSSLASGIDCLCLDTSEDSPSRRDLELSKRHIFLWRELLWNLALLVLLHAMRIWCCKAKTFTNVWSAVTKMFNWYCFHRKVALLSLVFDLWPYLSIWEFRTNSRPPLALWRTCAADTGEKRRGKMILVNGFSVFWYGEKNMGNNLCFEMWDFPPLLISVWFFFLPRRA